MMDTLERFYIFRETKLNNQINDKLRRFYIWVEFHCQNKQ